MNQAGMHLKSNQRDGKTGMSQIKKKHDRRGLRE